MKKFEFMSAEINNCSFCGMDTSVRMHHLIPRAKNGTETTPTCQLCENYIHSTWTHNQLRDTFNSIETILKDNGFQRFLKWRLKQSPTILFKSSSGKFKDKNKYH